MRLASVALALALLAGCSSSSPSKDLRRGTGTTGALAPGQTVTVPDAAAAGDLAGAAVTVHPKAQGGPQGQVTIGAADADIVPAGYTALTLPVKFDGGPGTWSRFASFVLPGKAARMPTGSVPGQVEIFWQRPGTAAPVPAAVPNIRVDDKDKYKSRFTFDCDELGTFQAAIRTNAGTKVTRHYTFRALGGVSMGGQGTGAIAFRHPDKYDMVGLIGPDPGVDLGYTLGYVHGNFMSGFCTSADEAAGRGAVGELCPLTRAPLTDQNELQESFEALTYQAGQGVGLTLRRSLYMRAIRDLSRAFGNPATYNPASSYLPPGVPEEFLTRADPCNNPVVLKGFYDARYNPDGSHDVITFCDGYDTAEGGYGVFIPGSQDLQKVPTQVLLAVDLNGNGKRDSGEPVIVQASEPYDDVGCDGCPDQLEDGQGGCVTDPALSAYDAATNPDPNRDNYHYLHNATGTEGNWRWDDCGSTHEPWQDAGLDGVAGAGCEAGSAAECFDYGEGNGKFDYNPMYLRWIAHDGPANYAKFDEATRARLDIYADAGIRDFFNGQVSVNQFFGLMRSMGENVRIWDTFQAMQDRGATDTSYSAINTDFSRTGSRHIFVRYGNPDATADQIDAGDGRHVGDPLTLVWRVQTMFRWMSARWPGGDYEDADVSASGDNFQKGLSFTTSWGRDTPFALFLPPGYFQNPDMRYPVIYFMHGYGQKPDDLVDSSVLFANYMVGKNYTKEQRYQKFIAVYVDGRCAPQWRLDNDPAPTGGDGCEEGTFYVDTPADRNNTAKMEQMLVELEQYIDATYRTKAAADVAVVQ
ncbi:MAG TPA: hypothetical protein VGQ83_14155 [Polyangia bacterium]|jgi:hypothetical protein